MADTSGPSEVEGASQPVLIVLAGLEIIFTFVCLFGLR